MKKLLLSVLFLLTPVLMQAQTFNWRVVSPAGGVSVTGNSVWYNVNAAPASFPSLSWTKSGTLASCTVQVDFSNDGSTVAGQAVPAQTCTSSGSNIQGASSTYHYVRVSYVIGSGGGSITYIAQGCITGTCTSGGGTGTPGGSNTNVQYNNAGAFGGNGGLTYDGSHILSVGSAGGGTSTLTLVGNTSGSATIAAPAVAGTNTNPFAFSNAILFAGQGSSANPNVTCSGCSNTGLYWAANSAPAMATPTGIFVFDGTVNPPVLRSTGTASPLGTTGAPWGTLFMASAAVVNINNDTGLSRIAANVLGAGNGTAANEAGLIRTGQACRITADVSLTVNTANSFCSYSLPASAKAWAFRCDILWAITVGSGTNTFALGINPSQTPTGTTNAEAQIYTTTTGTQTLGSAAISASGATTILTGATYTPAATIQLAKISGTVLASSTAGTFAITATANGTTATAAVKAGTQCQIF